MSRLAMISLMGPRTARIRLSAFAEYFYGKSYRPQKRGLSSVHQTIFVLFLLLAAIVWRDSDLLVYPQAAYVFAAFLVSNIATNYILTKYRLYYWMVDAMVVWNCVCITGLVRYSGGLHSYLWVLYLLPIFTAAILMSVRQLAMTVFLAAAGAASFYSGSFSTWDSDVAFELASKIALMFLGAFLMHSLASERDRAEHALDSEREKLDQLSYEVAQQNLETVKNMDMVEMGRRASGVVHDLGTPVTVILGSARLLLAQEETPSKADIRRILDAAVLCRDILSSAMHVAKGEEYKFESLDLGEPLESAIAIAEPILSASNTEFVRVLDARSARVRGSRIHLQRLFLNLLMNSKNVLKNGGSVKVSSSCQPDKHIAEVVFDDSGPGFPAQLLAEGPKPFVTGRAASGGTGLGLVVCKEIAERHGGSLALSNRLLGGARVTVRLPLAAACAQPAENQPRQDSSKISAPSPNL